jgi:carbonic anhydrase
LDEYSQPPQCTDRNACLPSLERFRAAIRGFKTRFYEEQPDTMRKLLEEGQHPTALLIGCSDSRVDPALLMGAEPGDLFMIRNVANLVPPYRPGAGLDGVGAAIEYAVRDLKVAHVIVLGHAHCGGIKALVNTVAGHRPEREFIGDWVSMAVEACRHTVSDPARAGGLRAVSLDSLKDYPYLVERASIQGSLRNLLSYPWLKAAVDGGSLSLHGWWFDLESGDLWATDADNSLFLPVTD